MKVRMREPGRRGHQTLVKLYASDRTARRQLQGHVAGGIRREPSRLRLDLSSALSEMLDRHGQQDSDGDECERYDPQRHGRDTDSFLGQKTEAVRKRHFVARREQPAQGLDNNTAPVTPKGIV